MTKSDIESVTAGEVSHEEMNPSDTIHNEKPTNLIVGSELHTTQKGPLEKRLLLKADVVILPLAALAYFVAYLDRNCIGNARVMGLENDLSMTDDQYYNCLTMFFIGYIVCLGPANITSRKLKPNRAIGAAVVFFGTCLCGMAAAQNYPTILALRILLGCGQGFVPIFTIYTSLWYKRDELASRSALYYSAATISGAFGGLISYGIQLNLTYSATGRHPWQWLFLVEGVLAIFVGLLVVVFLPRFPDDLQQRQKKHWLFSQEEINLAVNRYGSYNTEGEKFQFSQLVATFKDPKTYTFAICQGPSVLGTSVVGAFLPTFINNFGFTPLQTQLFTVIPYACAFFSVLGAGFASDRWNTKFPFLLTGYCVGCLGYILVLATTNTIVVVIAACLITAGCYVCIFMLPIWISINTGGFTKRGATWALSEITGLTFSIMGTRIYTNPPRFIKGHAVVLSLNFLAVISCIFSYWWMRSRNLKKDRVQQEYAANGRIHEHIANDSTLEEVYDQHISFRYVL